MLVHVDFNPPLILKLIDVDDLSGLYIIRSVRSSKPIKMMVDVRFCPIRMNAAATTNRCLARDSAWVPENLLHRFHLTALFIHIYLAPSSLHELSRIGLDASIAFTRNMEPLNGRTGLVQLRPAFKDWSASGFASSRQPPHSQGAGCRLQPDVLSRFLLNQIQFSSQPTNLFQKTQSTYRFRTKLTVEVYNWFKLTVWSYPAFSPDHKYTPSCERWELTGCTMHPESNLARLLTPNTRVDCLSPGDTTCLSKTPTIQ